MIPKTIHYCWLSGDPFPQSIQECIDTWRIHLKDYEICLWDTRRFPLESHPWVKEAFEAKKYAFAADYIRLFALYNYGGIYLDSDVYVYKNFDDLLNLPYFIGEDFVHGFEPAIIGAQKGNKWIEKVLMRYENRHFVSADGAYDTLSLPKVFLSQLKDSFQFNLLDHNLNYIDNDSVINIFPKEYFNSRNYIKPIKTKYSYCTHRFAGSWLNPQSGARRIIQRITPSFIGNLYYAFRYNLTLPKNDGHRIPFNNE